jgi:uncharacterized membrane protein (UPF0127 family)
MLAAAAAGCGESEPAAPADVTINGRTWRVELATTTDARYKGLSDRRKIDPNGGMLFIYPAPQMLDFCMRNCLVSLDIAFIASDLRVVKIRTMPVEPYGFEEKTYPSEFPAQYALEVAAGQLAAAGVKVGDKVEFSPGVPPAAKAAPGP